MFLRSLLRPCFLFALLVITIGHVQANDASASLVPQTWQLLDYMASDYEEAVANGQVIDDGEYAEQQEFAQTVKQQLTQLPDNPEKAALISGAQQLIDFIDQKRSNAEVSTQAHKVADALIDAYPIPTAPTNNPDMKQGAQLYQTYCASCHGASGNADGPAAKGLDPEPIAFTDIERADKRSPLSYFQTMTQGVEGTSMASYGEQLDENDRWALSYYISTIPYHDLEADGKTYWQKAPLARAQISNLEELSRTRGEQLDSVLGKDNTRALLGYLRTNPAALKQALTGLALARGRLAASIAAYQAGDKKDAIQLALSAYLDGVESVEPLIDAHDRSLRAQIELQMGAYRTGLSRGYAADQLSQQAEQVDDLLAQAQDLTSASVSSPTTTFVGAFIILLREGLEALLIVIGLIAFLKKADRKETLVYVHSGWLLALVAGGLTWFIARYFINISGASRELIEGLSALFAVFVLLGVGLWMHQKSVGNRWQVYLKEKMSSALSKKSAWLLFVLAFVSVYREIFETILFYIALWQPGHGWWMLGGIGAAVVALAIIAWLMLATSKRVPLSTFFAASSAVIVVLAFVLTGKGIGALQEAGWVDVSLAPIPHIDWLGIMPTWETTLGQLAIVVIIIAGYLYNRHKTHQA